jgi:hypothetical protein
MSVFVKHCNKVNGKGEFVAERKKLHHEDVWGTKVKAPRILNLCTRWW